MNSKILVLNSEKGVLKYSEILEGSLEDVVKKVIIRALSEWNPLNSDLIVMKQTHEVRINEDEMKEILPKFNFKIKRTPSGEIIMKLSIYIISYDSKWVNDDIYDNKIYLVAPYINENIRKELEEIAIELTLGTSILGE